MTVKRTPLILLLILTGVLPLSAYEGGSRDIYFKVAGARDTHPPVIMEDKLILLYKPSEPTRFVGAAFGHEDYTVTHPFKINEYGVFFLIYPLPQAEKELTYRLIVDGLWMADPANPRRIPDRLGITLSRLPLPEKEMMDMESPRIGPDGRVTFSFRASKGEQVYLAGSFNHWDPFMYKMDESPHTPGLYQITLPLRRGTHYYYFLYRGIPLTDPENLDVSLDANEREVSVFQIP